MLVGSGFGDLPGMQAAIETFEQAWSWGPNPQLKFTNAQIASTASDPTNSPTFELRPGLLLGLITSSGQWTNYSATNVDGSQVAAGIVIEGLRMQDVFSGVNTAKFWAICVGGNIRAAGLIGLDGYARSSLSSAFLFDDDFAGRHWFDWKSFLTKTAAYTILASDNFTLFDNTGATGAVTLTLPPIANGLRFGIRCAAAQSFALTSNEGGNLIGSTLTQNTVTISAIGAGVEVYTNPAGTQWIVQNISSTTQSLTFS